MFTKVIKYSLLAGVSLIPVSQSFAQDDADSVIEIEEVVVTGSYIRRASQFDSASPIKTIGSEGIRATGAKSVADITQNMTINTGSQNNPDAFTQIATTGTSNFNLRGLGVASTLVLLNGRRQVLTGVTTNDGLSFVDNNALMPMIAVDRVEILKDGAAALYGSDAVAGVVNFITRDNFEGLELSGDYQAVTDQGSQRDYNIQGILGIQGDAGGVILSASYTDRTPLTTGERRLSRPQDDSSALGNPGAFFGVPGFPAGVPVIDPTGCEEFGGIRQVFSETPAGVPDPGFCRFDFGDFFNLVAEEQRIQTFARGNYQITDSITFKTELGYSRNSGTRGNSPTFPVLTLPTVPADHPGNVFGVPVNFFGRAIGNGGVASDNKFESDTWRVSTSLTGEMDNGWYWELGYTRASNEFEVSIRDTLSQKFQDALNGFGGPNCNVSTGVAGEGDCLYFNPFSTSFTTLPNDPAVFDVFLADLTQKASSRLTVIDAVASGELFEMPAGAVGIAVGFQYREESLAQNFNKEANQDQFAFLIGNPNFDDERSIYAVFAEASVPVMENLELQMALRFEDYGGTIGDTINPKIAAIYRPTDNLTVRGSFSTSFRAPSIFQTAGTSTTLNQVSDPVTGGTFFAGVRAVGNAGVQPEESQAWNFGLSYEPIENLTIDLDYWRFDFTDVIIQENFQAILDAFPQDTDRVVRAGDPLNGPVIRVNTNFANASSVETDGLDFSVRYVLDTDFGTFQPSFEGTYILNYDLIDPQAGVVDGAGNRNFRNFGTSTPELRFNAGVAWVMGAHSVNSYVRYIDSYTDDQNAGIAVDSHTTVDVQYNLDIGEMLGHEQGAVLTVGAINLFDKAPPQLFTNAGFDSKVHDPRGRLFYVRGTISF